MNDREKLFQLCNTVMALSIEVGKVIERNNLNVEDKQALETVLDMMTVAVYDDFNELTEEFKNGELL